jgi:hypothetical protein
LHDQNHSTWPQSAIRTSRSLNASLAALLSGKLKPAISQQSAGSDGRPRDYFQFPNGQIRRQIGEGHSRIERNTRRELKRLARLQVRHSRSIYQLAAAVITQRFGTPRFAAW